jgi:hypothetical protein
MLATINAVGSFGHGWMRILHHILVEKDILIREVFHIMISRHVLGVFDVCKSFIACQYI